MQTKDVDEGCGCRCKAVAVIQTKEIEIMRVDFVEKSFGQSFCASDGEAGFASPSKQRG
jgi:hypothetical protein